MNDDALAAVIAAARLLSERRQRSTLPPPASRWSLASRGEAADVASLRLVAQSASRWAMRGRLGG